jgi:hypothetical protein
MSEDNEVIDLMGDHRMTALRCATEQLLVRHLSSMEELDGEIMHSSTCSSLLQECQNALSHVHITSAEKQKDDERQLSENDDMSQGQKQQAQYKAIHFDSANECGYDSEDDNILDEKKIEILGMSLLELDSASVDSILDRASFYGVSRESFIVSQGNQHEHGAEMNNPTAITSPGAPKKYNDDVTPSAVIIDLSYNEKKRPTERRASVGAHTA